MAVISITLSAPVMTAMGPTAVALLDARGIDHSGMTSTQIAQRYAVEVLRDVYVGVQTASAQTTAQATVNSTKAQAVTDATTGIT